LVVRSAMERLCERESWRTPNCLGSLEITRCTHHMTAQTNPGQVCCTSHWTELSMTPFQPIPPCESEPCTHRKEKPKKCLSAVHLRRGKVAQQSTASVAKNILAPARGMPFSAVPSHPVTTTLEEGHPALSPQCITRSPLFFFFLTE
jgi:hypothetical protein